MDALLQTSKLLFCLNNIGVPTPKGSIIQTSSNNTVLPWHAATRTTLILDSSKVPFLSSFIGQLRGKFFEIDYGDLIQQRYSLRLHIHCVVEITLPPLPRSNLSNTVLDNDTGILLEYMYIGKCQNKHIWKHRLKNYFGQLTPGI